MWLDHYKCTVLCAETNSEKDIVKAKHNGYEKIGVSHTRELIFDKQLLQIKIIDILESKENVFIEMPFHFHPSIEIKKDKENLFELINKNGRNAQLQTDEKLKTSVVKGQTEPEIAGWYSKSFLEKEPSNTLISALEFSGSIQLQTIILIN